MVSERLSMPLSGVAPELRRRERNTRLIGLALLVPAALLAAGFLYYPLLFIIQMSFTEGSSYLSQSGPVQTLDNYRLIVERYLPNLFVTVQLAFLATVVDLVLGFPFAYILVRRVRYRDVVRALMVFPMFGALYVTFGISTILLPGGLLAPDLQRVRHHRHVAAVQPPDGRVRDVDLHVPVHGHEHRDRARRTSTRRWRRRPPAWARDRSRRSAGSSCRSPGRASSRARCWSSAGASVRSPSRRCSAASTSSARSR